MGMSFAQLRVATKLAIGFGIVIVLLAVSGAVAYLSLSAVRDGLTDVVHDKYPKTQSLQVINENVLMIARSLRNAVLTIDSPDKVKSAVDDVLQSRQRIKETLEKLEPTIRLPEGKAALARIKEARVNFIAGQDEVIRLVRENKPTEARDFLLTEMRQRQATYFKATKELADIQERLMQQVGSAAEADVERSIRIIVAIVICATLASIVIAWLIVRSLTRQLGGEPAEAAELVRAVAAGDLSRTVVTRPGDSESMLYSIRQMQEGLSRLVAEIEAMVVAAGRGDFGTRIELAGKQGFGLTIAGHLNDLSSTTRAGLDDVIRVAGALARGDLSQQIEKDYPGAFGETRAGVNATVDALRAVVADVSGIVEAATQGDFSRRLTIEGRQGYVADLAVLLNRLSATTEEGLKDIMAVAQSLADGDLTHTIEKDYPGLFGETRTGINTTVANLSRLIAQVKDAVRAIQTATGEISAGNQDLSSRTEEQASSLEETAASMEQLTTTVKANTDGASQASAQAHSASLVAEQGGQSVTESVRVMGDIADSSKRIADIIGVIDGIAFQTNILSLNAAVEAARAGDQGRGFAVVATEVRNLAKRSADAAKEIKSLIGDSLSKIDQGRVQIEGAGAQMGEIVVAIRDVSSRITDIAQASREQSTGIEQIALAVGQMDEVTQQNAALVEQAAAAAEALSDQADELARAVGVFRLAGQGEATGRPALLAPPRRMAQSGGAQRSVVIPLGRGRQTQELLS